MSLRNKLYTVIIKRPVGFMGSLLAIVLLSPIFICTVIVLFFANKNGVKGIFFTQERPGKNEKIFRVLKFKSMTDERDNAGNLLPDRMRLTKVGKFIRGTSIDELPQLFNILKGDMAFIGPRPLLIRYLPYYTERERLRHSVRPGMSGWAQVNGRNNITWDHKLECDAYYAENVSLLFDLKIIIMTVIQVIRREGAVADKEEHYLDVERKK